MTKFQSIIYFVTISAPYTSDGHVPGFLEIGQDSMGTALRNADGIGYIADSRVWISAEVNKYVAVVGEKGPFAADF
jgi:hypothetical protein